MYEKIITNLILDKFGPFCKFKGGSPDSPPSPRLGGYGKWAQSELYKNIERALSGGGLMPTGGFAQRRAAYQKVFPQVQEGLESNLNRLVPREDVKVRDYARGMLSRGYYGLQDELRQQEKMRPYEEQQQAIGMGLGALAQEKRMGLDLASMYNTYLKQQAQMPTFQSTLGYGMGQAGGWAAAGAAEKYARGMSNTFPNTGAVYGNPQGVF